MPKMRINADISEQEGLSTDPSGWGCVPVWATRCFCWSYRQQHSRGDLSEMWKPMGTRQVKKGEAMKRIFAVFLLLLGSSLCEAGDRIRMVEAPPAESLMNSIASACNEKDFQRFMGHFTPKRATAIRGTMEDLFIQYDLEMDIQDVTVLSTSDDKIVFGVRYGWHGRTGPKQVLSSKVTALKVGDAWKVDSEEIRKTTREPIAQQQQGQAFNFGGGGAVVMNPGDDLLPRDIGRRPGGCANGRCGL
jgi:hypothetical protein